MNQRVKQNLLKGSGYLVMSWTPMWLASASALGSFVALKQLSYSVPQESKNVYATIGAGVVVSMVYIGAAGSGWMLYRSGRHFYNAFKCRKSR